VQLNENLVDQATDADTRVQNGGEQKAYQEGCFSFVQRRSTVGLVVHQTSQLRTDLEEGEARALWRTIARFP